jgi:hypothetical protein
MELTMSSLIKLIIGILVVVAVIVGVYFFFKDKVIDLFGGISADVGAGLILLSIKK